jgi:hypothetical protein
MHQHPRDISRIMEASYTVKTRRGFLRGAAIRYTTDERRYIPFPDKTRGFLYYKSPDPGNPDFSGTLRFRVISDGSNSFADGVDLKLPSGLTWEMHLYSSFRTARHAGLVEKLVEEELVSPSVVEKLHGLPTLLLHRSCQILYRLEDPFVSNLHGTASLVVMTQDGVASGPVLSTFHDPRKAINVFPYRGMPSYQPPE